MKNNCSSSHLIKTVQFGGKDTWIALGHNKKKISYKTEKNIFIEGNSVRKG